MPSNALVDNRWHFDWRELGDRFVEWSAGIPMPRGLCLEIGIGKHHHHYKTLMEGLGYKWVGIEIAQYPDCKVVGDAHRLPFQANTFSLVAMRCVIEHLQNPWAVLKEVHRTLRKEAYVCGSVSFLEPFHGSYFHFTHWGVKQLLMDTGFSPVSIEPGTSYYLPLVPSLFPARSGSGYNRAALRFASLSGKLVIKPILKLQKVLGYLYIVGRFGRDSEEYKLFARYQEENPFRYAGHINFLAKRL